VIFSSIAPILLRAAELVETRGLAKRQAEDGPKICTQRAIHLAAWELREYPGCSRAFSDAFRFFSIRRCGGGDVVTWNDLPEVTAEVVAWALRRTAEEVER
jgi:hypothetical protein